MARVTPLRVVHFLSGASPKESKFVSNVLIASLAIEERAQRNNALLVGLRWLLTPMNGHGKFYCPRLWKILLSKFTKTKHNQRISLWIFVPPKPKCCLIKVNKSNFGAIGVKKHAVEQSNGYLLENQRYLKLPQYMGNLWSNWVRSIWAQTRDVMWV